jgi:hypothetical protein
MLKEQARLYNILSAILKALVKVNITVYVTGLSKLRPLLERELLETEKKSMIEEYMYKVIAGRLVAYLIDVPEDVEPDDITPNLLVDVIKSKAEKIGLTLESYEPSPNKFELIIYYQPQDDDPPEAGEELKLTDYLPPSFPYVTYRQLVNAVKPVDVAPDSITHSNVERIRQWLEAGNRVVVSKWEFVRKILHTGNPQFYTTVIQILQDAGYIRLIDGINRGRKVTYVILDPKARICGNCIYYGDAKNCPLAMEIFDPTTYYERVKPWNPVCEKFANLNEEGDEE